MFDPTKIDLDLDSSPEKNNTGEKKSTQNKNEIKSEEKADVLSNENEVKSDDSKIKEDSEDKTKNTEVKIDPETEEKINEKSQNTDTKQGQVKEIEKDDEEKIIFDININSVEYLIKYIVSKEYDFFIIEPEENKVKISFKKDNLEKEVKYIKYPVYSAIILKAKSLTKLKVEDIENSQEGS